MSDSEAIKNSLVPPPPRGVGVCFTCRSWTEVEGQPCNTCAQVEVALGAPALALNVVTLYRKPSALRDWLTGYKGSPDGVQSAVPASVSVVRALVGRVLMEHGQALLSRMGTIDGMVVVPSTDRVPPHPLARVLNDLATPTRVLPWLARGPGQLGFRQPASDGYVVTAEARSETRVLLVDDVYTTGARANSAALALREAGITVAALLVIARRINPEFDPRAADLWARQVNRRFNWSKSPVIAPRD